MKIYFAYIFILSFLTIIMARVISIISGKGGVGKTTTAVNLGASLVEMGRDVTIIDGNLTTPNLSLHLGIPLYPITLHDVLKGKAYLTEAIYIHPSGIKVIPASLSVDALRGLKPKKLQNIIRTLSGKNGIVLIDSAAGLGREAHASILSSDELIIVTNPELTAVTDALRTIKVAEKEGNKILGIVVNKIKGYKHELSIDEIQSMLEVPVIGVVPEDKKVKESIALKTPVVHFYPAARVSKEFKKIAHYIEGIEYKEPKKSWIESFFEWMR